MGSTVRNEGVRTVVGPYESQAIIEISLLVERVNRHLGGNLNGWRIHFMEAEEETYSPLEILSPKAMQMV